MVADKVFGSLSVYGRPLPSEKNQTRQQGETSPERAANQEQKEYSKYSETCIKRTPSIKRTVAKVPEFISLICFK